MNIRVRPLDTSEEADMIQTEIYRRMKPEQRLQIGFEASTLSRSVQAAGVRFRHPEYDEDEVRLAVIRINLGDLLFCRVYPNATHIVP